jgi:GDP-mannose 6-dehydrogenase
MNPEFMREGTSVEDFFHPPKIVVGDSDRKAGDRMEEMYKGLNLPVIRTSLKVAEMIKYADNTFHAVKVTFANEIGNICKKSGIDSHKVMEIFCKDTKLNLSPYYLKPGFAFGGSCLPKDIRAIRYRAKIEDVETPLLSSVMVSNYNQIITVVNKLLEFRGKKLGFIGLSFKKDTDDMRESPVVEVIETMIGKGFNVRIFDDNVTLTNLVGANRAYIEREIPHLARLLCDSLEEIFKGSDVIIISKKWEGLVSCIKSLKEGQTVIDLVRIAENYSEFGSGKYYGICW